MFIKMFFLVMLLLLSGGSAEVVTDFKIKCGNFFKNGISPTVLPGTRYRQICQTLGDQVYYATLYDTENKIPVYSAYVFKGKMGCSRSDNWYIEPQLENLGGSSMEQETSDLYNQASNKDYRFSNFHRGHLAPVYHASSQDCADATFTLTNAAPQYPSFNIGKWKSLEYNMAKMGTEHCDKTAHIVTGVVPGDKKMNNRVNVPSYFWTAYCCFSTKAKRLISGGAIGLNSQDNLETSQISVRVLEKVLAILYQVKTFILFDNNCGDAQFLEIKQ